MDNAQKYVLKGLTHVEKALGNHTFTWIDGNNYPCDASIIDTKRDLGDGGFVIDKLLTMTVRQYNTDETPVFINNIIPQSQQRIMYNGTSFRIASVKVDSIGIGARMRIVAVCTTRGITG